MAQRIIPYRNGNVIYLGFAISGIRPRAEREQALREKRNAEIIQLPLRSSAQR